MYNLPGLPHNDVIPRLKEKVLNFKQVMPSIISLRNPSLKGRHWDQIETLIGKSIVRNKEFTLGDLIEMNVSVNLLNIAYACVVVVVDLLLSNSLHMT